MKRDEAADNRRKPPELVWVPVTRFSVEVEQEDDDRWLAEVVDLPGALAYGKNRQEAVSRAEALALRVLAERLEHDEC